MVGKPNIHPAETNNVKLASYEGPGRGVESKVPVEIRNDVTRKPEGEASRERSGGGADRRNFYLQITALILEILQPLVVQFLAVSHVSASVRVVCNRTGQ